MKMFDKIIPVVATILVVWFVASWADVISDNCEPNPTHSNYNSFIVFEKNS